MHYRQPRPHPEHTASRNVRRLAAIALGLTMLMAWLAPTFTAPRSAAADAEGTPQQRLALERMNYYRALSGVPPMRLNPALDRAASNHATYYVRNFGDPSLSGMGLHNETPGLPGFTGVTMEDRIKGAGYSGLWNEGINTLGDPVTSVDSFMATVNHRLPIMDPAYRDVGYGGNATGRAKIDVFTYGGPYNGFLTPEFVGYPSDGQSGVTTRYSGSETNAAFPGAAYPTGTAITLKYTGPGALVLGRAAVSGPDGRELPVLTHSNYNFITRNVIVVAPKQPLAPGTRYSVRIEGTKNGNYFMQSWSFTTHE